MLSNAGTTFALGIRDMEDGESVAILIGSSPLAEEVRRELVREGVPVIGSTGHLNGVRGLLLDGTRAAACVTIDSTTMSRYGRSLQTLLSDLHGFPMPCPSVGLLADVHSVSRVGRLEQQAGFRHGFREGCTIFTSDVETSVRAMCEWLAASPWPERIAQRIDGVDGLHRRDGRIGWDNGLNEHPRLSRFSTDRWG